MNIDIDLILKIKNICPETIIAFSCGKDSVAAWLALRDYFDKIFAFYLYLVPDLEFVDESLLYYERFFSTRIVKLPHPSLHRWLNAGVFQPPERNIVIEQASLPNHNYEDIRKCLIDDFSLPEKIMVADGVRAADSPIRHAAIKKYGPISYGLHKYHPIWNWKKSDLVDVFRKSGVKLPFDYLYFGRTFDGLDLRFIIKIKKHFPRDYKKILEWFPLCDLEIFRYEKSR